MEENVIDVKDTNLEKKRSSVIINILIVIGIFIVSLFMYAKYIGTSGLVIHEYRLKSELIPKSFSGIKIVYFSDILYGSTVSLDDIQNLVNEINIRNPDIVLFGGDLLSDNFKLKKKDKEKIIEMFSNIEAKLGKYAVTGSGDKENVLEILSQSNFVVMKNSHELIYNESDTPICLFGVGSYNLGEYDLNVTLQYLNTNPNCYSILFSHESDVISNILALQFKPNVIFAGNSLGGEINVPFYGPLNKFEGSKKYYLNYYNKNKIEIYISSGIGTKDYNMRLFNRPSFNFFRLKSDTKK